MGRRSRGDGSVYYDADRGCWVGSIDIGRDPQTRRRRRRKVSAATKTECRDKLDKLRGEKARTGTVAPRNITVEKCVRDLLASPPPAWRSPVTIEVNTAHAERVIRAVGKIRLVNLTPGQVRAMLDQMTRDGYATATISGTKGILAQAIRRAEQEGLAGRNVAQLTDTPRGTRSASRSMTLDQIRTLFASDLSAWMRAYLMAGILCGLRPGELLGLTWDDVDFGTGVIRVRHCLKAVRGQDGHRVLQLENLKTERSKRTLALPAKAAEALKALRSGQAAAKLRLGRYYDSRGIVFCGDHGQPLWQATVNRRFKQTCKLAGIGSHWHAHEQRHTFVSVLSDAGLDIEAIADAAGHINSSITRTVYRHQIADKVSRAAAAMDDIFGKVSGS
jgi:integrase